MKKPVKYWPILLIVLLAFFLRVYKLGQFPVGFLWDEAALGYNAYSILETGKDEFGAFFPLIFKSFGDYKPGLYVYLTIPSVLIFGLNEFAVRLPSALAGTAAVLILYLLLTESSKPKGGEKQGDLKTLALLASLVLAINPWHINFSRGAWELNVMLTEILLGIYFLVKFLNLRKSLWLYLGIMSLISSLFTYQAGKFLFPVLIMALIWFYRRQIQPIPSRIKFKFLSICFIGFALVNLLTAIGGKAGRIKVMSIFSYPRSNEKKEMILNQDNQNQLIYRLFHDKPVFFLRSVLERYFNHFSGKFLFVTGDWSNPRNGVIYQGVLYYLDAVFLVLGLAILARKKRSPLENLMILWFLIAPLFSALTRDNISSVRSFTMVIPLVFIIAEGLVAFINFSKKFLPIIRYSLFIILAVVYFFFFVRFLDLYFIHDPKFNSEDRLYGYRQVIKYLLPLVSQKDKVIFTTTYGQPYIYWLFYSKYDPATYQKKVVFKENPYGDVGEVERIDNLEFRKVYFPADRSIPNAFLVDDEFGLPTRDITSDEERFRLIKEITFLNDKVAFRVVETIGK